RGTGWGIQVGNPMPSTRLAREYPRRRRTFPAQGALAISWWASAGDHSVSAALAHIRRLGLAHHACAQ
ncbi:hypothetical protein, partial [Corynebacterium argentoratense]|uniref:hypothetical protein n=1 Tax=Corynebacterium argentoratense TaxID=42817 RepID=UPI001F384F55